jgi:hypothetical protein
MYSRSSPLLHRAPTDPISVLALVLALLIRHQRSVPDVLMHRGGWQLNALTDPALNIELGEAPIKIDYLS